MGCLYCGNISGKQDVRGNCIGCGAPLPIKPDEELAELELNIDLQWMQIGGQPPTPKWYVDEYYRGFSGSPYGYSIPFLLESQIVSPQEVRGMMENE